MSAPVKKATPRVDACIEAVSKRFPSLKSTAYFEEVHQHIAPLAREMEREIADLRAAHEKSARELAASRALCDAHLGTIIDLRAALQAQQGEAKAAPAPVTLSADLSGLTIWSHSPTMGVMVSNSPRQEKRKQFYLVEDVRALLAAAGSSQGQDAAKLDFIDRRKLHITTCYAGLSYEPTYEISVVHGDILDDSLQCFGSGATLQAAIADAMVHAEAIDAALAAKDAGK